MFNASQGAGLTTTNVVVGRTSLSRLNWRLAIALFVAGLLWIGPYIGSIGVVMPALVAQVAPDDRVALVGLMGILGAALSLVSNILFGALSDLTRSRFGARTPWILVGAIGTAVGLWGLSSASTPVALVVWWSIYMLLLNAIIAPMVAVISDRVPEKYRGTISSIYGVSLVVGSSLSQIVGAGFVSDPRTGLIVFAVVTLISGPFFVLMAPDRSNRDVERQRMTARDIARSFSFPTRGARDFYFALFGKFALMAGAYAITNFQLYILTDYINLSEGAAAGIIALMATITLVTSLVFGLGAGPLSDRLGRRKPFVIVAALLIGVGILFPFLAPFAWAMVVYSVLSGIGNGAYSSVDQALNIEVLPSKKNAAKDLGLLNMANSGGQILGPVLTSVLVGITGGYQASFIAAFVLLVISAVLMIPIKRVR
ncbi:MFS transporter [Curtobacterium flaccumfaciens]|uniref:MFS transporter n=1 Tax=Curtobacterium flaccumfaciens TaxID=2035 RepID=UPI003433AC49